MIEETKTKPIKKLLFPKTTFPEDAPENHIPQILECFRPKPDNVLLKFYPDSHRLSAEEQYFFMKITEGIFGYHEQVRNETLKLLTCDFSIRYLAPHLTEFIKQTVCLNLVCSDLTLLIYSVRMTKNLILNPHVDVKLYLHDLIPAVLSCALSKRISKYYYDNHWTLRDFSTYVIATICHVYSNEMNKIKERVISVYLQPIYNNSMPLTSLYGGLKGLTSLGEEIIKIHIIPNLYMLGKRVYKILENKNYKSEDKQGILEAQHVCDVVLNAVSPILIRSHPLEGIGKYLMREFGYFGYLMFVHMKNSEKAESEHKNVKNVL